MSQLHFSPEAPGPALTWERLMALRLAANEKVTEGCNVKLSHYEGKLSMKKMFQKHGIPFTKVNKNGSLFARRFGVFVEKYVKNWVVFFTCIL